MPLRFQPLAPPQPIRRCPALMHSLPLGELCLGLLIGLALLLT